MDIRNALNQRPYLVTVVSVVLILVAGYFAWRPSAAMEKNKLFFTVDDGKTHFAADAKLVPPCTIDGKTAVFAYVYRCPTCGKQFVGNMGRYKADRVEALRNRLLVRPEAASAARPQISAGPGLADLEMKRPGEPESAWKVPGSSGNMAALMKEAASGVNIIRCPDHRNVVAEPVTP